MDLRKIGQYIASKRKEQGLTQVELAEKLGCSDSTVKRELQYLSQNGILMRIGSRKSGVWAINR